MSVNIQINKKTDDGYETFYPTNNAYNVIRDTHTFTYIDGDNLLEIMQDMANKYIPHKCANWRITSDISELNINQDSVMGGDDRFLCIFTVDNSNNTHKMVINISYGSMNWRVGEYINSDVNTQINQIKGLQVQKMVGGYCAVITGTATLSSEELNSYAVFFLFNNQTDVVYDSITIFSGNKVPLIQGGE